jgi:hypothetical protein
LTDEGYVLSADFRFESEFASLEEAVNRGVVLHFVADFELTRERWYWLDEKLLSRSLTYRLSYHALTRQYRLTYRRTAPVFRNAGRSVGACCAVCVTG